MQAVSGDPCQAAGRRRATRRGRVKVTVRTGGVDGLRADLLAVPIAGASEGSSARLPRGLGPLDERLGGVLRAALSSGDWKGRTSEKLIVYPTADGPVKRVLLVGTGSGDELDAERLRRFAGTAASEARDREATRVAIVARRGRGMDDAAVATALTEGAVLGAYRYDRHQASGRKRGSKATEPRNVALVFDEVDGVGTVRQRVADAVVGAESQLQARDLSNAPPNEMPPSALAAAARAVAREAGLLCRVMRGTELERRGFGALLAVGSGSANPPCMIVLEHAGGGKKARSGGRSGRKGSARRKSGPAPVCLVGKGITFDSGGLSLKPAVPMLDMKHDMSGAATVIATMRAVGLRDLPHPVIGVVAAAENMPSGTAYRPSDILTSASGKTIEVVNTDAEGRLVLADALHYAIETWSPRAIVDVATLTGAAMMAFGPWATAALGNDDGVIGGLREAGDTSGERMWPMPLLREHHQAIKSSVADIKNSGGASAGVSTAAAFLAEFVGDTPWVHLDIAGTGWSSTRHPYHRGGATGVGVRTLLAWLRDGCNDSLD